MTQPHPYQHAVLFGLQWKHIYAGTVPAGEIRRRRARAKAAKKARRANRPR